MALEPHPIPSWQDKIAGLPNMMALQDMLPFLPGVVDLERARKLLASESAIRHQIQGNYTESSNARKSHEQHWKVYQNLYDCIDDAPLTKARWQSRAYIPQCWSKVEMAKTMVRGALLGTNNWFELETFPSFQEKDPKIRAIEKILRLLLEDAEYAVEHDKSEEEAFVYGTGCLRIGWKHWIDRKPRIEESPAIDPMSGMPIINPMTGQPAMNKEVYTYGRKTDGLEVRYVPLWAMFPDPYSEDFYEGRYVIEEMALDEEEIVSGMAVGQFYELTELGSPVKWEYELDLRGQTADKWAVTREGRKRHLMRVQHGNWYDDEGYLCLQNWRCFEVNKSKVLSFCPNPLYTGKWPYIWGRPQRVRGSVWGRSLIKPAAQLQIEMNQIARLMIDSTRFSVLPAATLNTTKVENAARIQALTPGGLYKVTGDNAVQPLKIASTPTDAMPMMQYIEAKIDESTAMFGEMAGEPPLKGRATATQYQGQMGAGRAQISSLAKNIERDELEPAVQLAYDNAQQFLSDVSSPQLQQIVAQQVGPREMLDEVSRLELLDAKFKVRARGISMEATRQEMQSKLMQTIQIAQQLNMPPPTMTHLFYKLVEMQGLDPRDAAYPETEQEMQMMQQQMAMAQQAAQAGGPGGGGKGPGSGQLAPEPPSEPTQSPGPPNPQDLIKAMQAHGAPMPPH